MCLCKYNVLYMCIKGYFSPNPITQYTSNSDFFSRMLSGVTISIFDCYVWQFDIRDLCSLFIYKSLMMQTAAIKSCRLNTSNGDAVQIIYCSALKFVSENATQILYCSALKFLTENATQIIYCSENATQTIYCSDLECLT